MHVRTRGRPSWLTVARQNSGDEPNLFRWESNVAFQGAAPGLVLLDIVDSRRETRDMSLASVMELLMIGEYQVEAGLLSRGSDIQTLIM